MPQTIEISHPSAIHAARQLIKSMASSLGFDERAGEEITLAGSELASNLSRHAVAGRMIMTPLVEGSRTGIQIESIDNGPGIADPEQSIADGYSTVGSLGYGLGTVNRLMDEFKIESKIGGGTRIICKRWVRVNEPYASPDFLTFGAASRPHAKMLGVNGDAFVIKQWNTGALAGIIDGLGHGKWAQRAAVTARKYVENHFDQALTDIFRGVGRACRPTRGVVMALAQFDFPQKKVVFAGIGNIEVRVFNSPEPVKFIIRRGIIGLNAPVPVPVERSWDPSYIMILHSDGVRSHWKWEDFPELEKESANAIAMRLLSVLARDEDDATVVVVRGKLS